MIGFKFAPQAVPFPTKKGYFLRIVLGQGDTLMQAHFMIFDGEKICELASGGMTTPEVVLEGDRRSQAEGMIVSYTEMIGINKFRKTAGIVGAGDGAVTPASPIITTPPISPEELRGLGDG